jgi:aryl-alcohol dehydrogenase-like predicted oxidoreductase
VLADAHAAGLGVIVKEAVANGRLTARDPELSRLGVLREVCEATGETPDAVALAAALAQPWADVVLSGAADVAQLQSNLRARTVVLPPGSAQALASLAERPEAYWAKRAALPWN